MKNDVKIKVPKVVRRISITTMIGEEVSNVLIGRIFKTNKSRVIDIGLLSKLWGKTTRMLKVSINNSSRIIKFLDSDNEIVVQSKEDMNLVTISRSNLRLNHISWFDINKNTFNNIAGIKEYKKFKNLSNKENDDKQINSSRSDISNRIARRYLPQNLISRHNRLLRQRNRFLKEKIRLDACYYIKNLRELQEPVIKIEELYVNF